jgi:hypothetical protein
MKTKILLILFCWVACAVNAQTATEKKLPWDYPVKPGTAAWKQIRYYQETLAILQIPENVLSSLSTENLAELCLQYPFLFELIRFGSYEAGLDTLLRRFNGVRELFKRNDASKELLKHYRVKIQNLPFLNSDVSLLDKGLFVYSVEFIEILLTRCHTREVAPKENYLEILKVLVDGDERKLGYTEYFGGSSFRANLYSRAHLIVKMDAQNLGLIPQKDREGVFTKGWADEQTINAINELSNRLINQNNPL